MEQTKLIRDIYLHIRGLSSLSSGCKNISISAPRRMQDKVSGLQHIFGSRSMTANFSWLSLHPAGCKDKSSRITFSFLGGEIFGFPHLWFRKQSVKMSFDLSRIRFTEHSRIDCAREKNPNTVKKTKSSLRVLKAYLAKKGINDEPEQIDPTGLNQIRILNGSTSASLAAQQQPPPPQHPPQPLQPIPSKFRRNASRLQQLHLQHQQSWKFRPRQAGIDKLVGAQADDGTCWVRYRWHGIMWNKAQADNGASCVQYRLESISICNVEYMARVLTICLSYYRRHMHDMLRNTVVLNWDCLYFLEGNVIFGGTVSWGFKLANYLGFRARQLIKAIWRPFEDFNKRQKSGIEKDALLIPQYKFRCTSCTKMAKCRDKSRVQSSLFQKI